MPDFGIYAGDTDKTIYVRLRDATTGLAKTGLLYNSAGAVCSYVLPRAARAAITLATQTVTGAHSDGGFVEVDATNCKGLYRLDLPDAAIASGAYTLISIEFDGIIEETIEIPLQKPKVDLDTIKTQSVACAAGVTVLASVGTAATSTAQTGDTYALANGANGFVALKGDTAAILADTGTDGVVVAAASKTGYSLTATTGLGNQTADITGNVSGSVGSVTAGVTLANGAHGGAAATMALGGAGGLTSTITGNVTGSVGSVTGAVGSVTGAVGSVTGNVGGNVVGTVAGVTPPSGTDWTTARAGYIDKLNVTGTLLHSAYTIADADSLTANSIPDHLRKMSWFTFNRMDVVEADGTFVVEKDDGTTNAATGSITSAAGTTTRSAPTWA